jgi:hypothetical protein
LTNPDNLNIINFDLWKQAAGGRHQIGTLAGFKSEQVAGFLLECMAGFVGIRNLPRKAAPRAEARRAEGSRRARNKTRTPLPCHGRSWRLVAVALALLGLSLSHLASSVAIVTG